MRLVLIDRLLCGILSFEIYRLTVNRLFVLRNFLWVLYSSKISTRLNKNRNGFSSLSFVAIRIRRYKYIPFFDCSTDALDRVIYNQKIPSAPPWLLQPPPSGQRLWLIIMIERFVSMYLTFDTETGIIRAFSTKFSRLTRRVVVETLFWFCHNIHLIIISMIAVLDHFYS